MSRDFTEHDKSGRLLHFPIRCGGRFRRQEMEQLFRPSRRLPERNGAQPPADPIAHLEEGDAQVGLFACDAPCRVGAGDAAAAPVSTFLRARFIAAPSLTGRRERCRSRESLSSTRVGIPQRIAIKPIITIESLASRLPIRLSRGSQRADAP
jgi:hypothetical protein